ncbi:MAG: Shikimate kinase [Cryomorphaceae bacterium]|nr:MAG: Shikimate kinase [Cryomorphaceae bacterium]
MKVFLIGYMASGKSTLGKALAGALTLPFIDLDVEIERTEGTSISEIVDSKGELHFRKIESGVLKDLLEQNDTGVFALGGGTPVFYNHMDLLNAEGETIFLDVPVGELAKRLEGDIKRPLIQNKEDVAEFVAKHMFERRAYYSQAKHRIAGPSISVEELKAVLN